jgi:hypothetical protein
MKILPDENILVGQWTTDEEGNVIADSVCRRIEELIKCHLKEIARDNSGWDVLYCNPEDGRLWELTYPKSSLHGGGPPQLRCVTSDEAKKKYGRIAGSGDSFNE